MPLLDHFHPPLHGPRRWEGFLHAWATFIAQQLNRDILPPDYFAESQISVGPEFEVDVATKELTRPGGEAKHTGTAAWSPSPPRITASVDFTQLDTFEIRVYQQVGGAELRAAIELLSPGNKDGSGSRRTFAAKCAGYIQHGIGVVIVDIVTARAANLHAELFDVLEAKGRRPAWESPTGLYAVAFRAVKIRKHPRVEGWPEPLALGERLPVMPLWLAMDLYVPVRLEESYLETCQSLRILA
ncbi:MAG TPA: hypothetical protein VG013_26230 [Gemmataceae bacterium]|jgi:hypothetical protein|nr:hypothetical protein [Gemmataceae bacterium]